MSRPSQKKILARFDDLIAEGKTLAEQGNQIYQRRYTAWKTKCQTILGEVLTPDNQTIRDFRQRKWPPSSAIEKELGILEGIKDDLAQGLIEGATVRTKRKQVKPDYQAEVLERCLRRCCVCFALDQDTSQKAGQISHLDHDPSNDDPDNLVFLCLHHHDQYDSKTSQSKNFTEAEVRKYRSALWRAVDTGLLKKQPAGKGPDSFIQHVVGNNSIINPTQVNVVYRGKSRGRPIQVPVSGTVSEDPLMRGYLKYLFDRYLTFKKWDCDKQGVKLTGAPIYRRFKREMKFDWKLTPKTHFEKAAEYLKAQICKTVLGKKRRAAGKRLYRSFEEFRSLGPDRPDAAPEQ